MARLDFDFHARPATPFKLGIALAIVGAASLVWVWSNLQAARTTEAGLSANIANIEQTRPHKRAKPVVPAENPGQAARARVASQMDYSWEPVFAALAAARSNKIALVSLEASQAKSQIKLVVEARHLADAKAVMMKTHDISEIQAYDLIREQAMSKRTTMEEIAAMIVHASEVLSLSGRRPC